MDKSKHEDICDKIYVNMKDENVGAEITVYVNELYNFVSYIATDWVESSHDKVRWQRDDYIKMAKKLLDEL